MVFHNGVQGGGQEVKRAGGAQARGGLMWPYLGAIGSFAAESDLAVAMFLSVHSANDSGRELEQVGVHAFREPGSCPSITHS